MRSGQGGLDTELVTLHIGEQHPTAVADLADIDPPGAQRDEPLDLLIPPTIHQAQIQMQAVLALLGLSETRKQTRPETRGRRYR